MIKTAFYHEDCFAHPRHLDYRYDYNNRDCNIHRGTRKACHMIEEEEGAVSKSFDRGGDPCPTCEARRTKVSNVT